MAFRVADAAAVLDGVVACGATTIVNHVGHMELNIPTLAGIGHSRLYLVNRYGAADTAGLTSVDHLTHNVFENAMDRWAGFYADVFNFREVRYFDIEGKVSGLRSRAVTSSDGAMRIPINESADGHSQIVEYLNAYRGEGIQYVSLATDDIYASVATLATRGVSFLAKPNAYYDAIDERLRSHGEDVARLREAGILIDGAPGQGLLLQIFIDNLIGPFFSN